MKKIKLTLLLGLLFFVGIYFRNMNLKSKEIELQNENIGNFYKKYIITKNKNGIELKDYFNNQDIIVEKEGIKDIINLEEKYELLQLNSRIYLKNLDKIKIVSGESRMRVGDYYIFKQNDSYGLIDKDLNVLIEPIYDGLFKGEKSSLLLAKKKDKYGYLDTEGRVVVPFEYEIGTLEKNGLMVVKKDNKIGVINHKNEVVVNFEYDGIYYENTKNFVGIKNGEYFLINAFGENTKIDASWMGVQNGSKMFYEKDGKFGIFDFEKKYITKNIYDELSQNYSQLIIALKQGKYGLINNDGETKLSFIFDYILPVGKNYFKAGDDNNGYVALANQEGDIITKQIYDDFLELNENNLIGMRENRLILMNKKGKEIKNIDSIINFNNEMLLYKKDGKNILRKL